jgi:integrase
VTGIDLVNQEATFIMKGDKWHTAGFGPDLKELLEKWLPVRDQLARPETKTLFINIRKGTPLTYSGLYWILKKLGAPSAHCFRRGAARQWASDGGNDRQGMEQGGWSTYEQYRRYTRGVDITPFKNKRWLNNGD